MNVLIRIGLTRPEQLPFVSRRLQYCTGSYLTWRENAARAPAGFMREGAAEREEEVAIFAATLRHVTTAHGGALFVLVWGKWRCVCHSATRVIQD